MLYDGHREATMDIRIRDIPEELHTAFKLTVTMNKTSIQQETMRLIEEYVRREKKVPYSPKKK